MPLTNEIVGLEDSARLEIALEDDPEQQRLGSYCTSPDVARWLAERTILPNLLADVAMGREELGRCLTENVDLAAWTFRWLEHTASREELVTFRKRLESLRVLDPTCGTGALLFAGLHLLAALAGKCGQRLGRSCSPRCMRKRIALRNLCGMDLSAKAVAICRQRFQLEAGTERVAVREGNFLTEDVAERYDVILGNPPYLELGDVGYPVEDGGCATGTTHGLCLERALSLLKPGGWLSFIVPMSLVSTQRMKPLQDLLESGREVWYANFAWRPARLFARVNRAVTIVTVADCAALGRGRPRTWTTGYVKWRSRERASLLKKIRFVEIERGRSAHWVPKLGEEREKPLLAKMLRVPTAVAAFLGADEDAARRIYYRTDGGLYWKVFTDFAPAFSCNGKAGPSTRETWVTCREAGMVAPLLAALSSDLFWWWYTVTSNCRHLNPSDICGFPLPASVLEDAELARLGKDYVQDIVKHSRTHVRVQKQTGRTKTQSFSIRQSRPLLLEIDRRLGPHYGLTVEEVRFLGEYDLEFRLGER